MPRPEKKPSQTYRKSSRPVKKYSATPSLNVGDINKAYLALKIVRVPRDNGLVSCDYAVKGRKNCEGKVTVTVDNKHINTSRFVYMAEKACQFKGKEVYHICGNTDCCRASHMEVDKDGTNLKRPCHGYVRFGSNDNIAKVCKHDPPCRVLTEYTDVQDVRPKLNQVGDCCGTVTCGNLSALVCHHAYTCRKVTDIESIRAKPEDVDKPDAYKFHSKLPDKVKTRIKDRVVMNKDRVFRRYGIKTIDMDSDEE